MRKKAFALGTFARQFAGTPDRFGLFTRPLFRRFFVVITKLHFAEDALTLHLLFQGLQRLIDIVVSNYNLHVVSFLFGAASPSSQALAKIIGSESGATFRNSRLLSRNRNFCLTQKAGDKVGADIQRIGAAVHRKTAYGSGNSCSVAGGVNCG